MREKERKKWKERESQIEKEEDRERKRKTERERGRQREKGKKGNKRKEGRGSVKSLLLSHTDLNWNSIRYLQACEEYRKEDIVHLSFQMMPYSWHKLHEEKQTYKQFLRYNNDEDITNDKSTDISPASQTLLKNDYKVVFPELFQGISTNRFESGNTKLVTRFLHHNLQNIYSILQGGKGQGQEKKDTTTITTAATTTTTNNNNDTVALPLTFEGGIYIDMQSINDLEIGDMGYYHGVTLVPWGFVYRAFPPIKDYQMHLKLQKEDVLPIFAALYRIDFNLHLLQEEQQFQYCQLGDKDQKKKKENVSTYFSKIRKPDEKNKKRIAGNTITYTYLTTATDKMEKNVIDDDNDDYGDHSNESKLIHNHDDDNNNNNNNNSYNLKEKNSDETEGRGKRKNKSKNEEPSYSFRLPSLSKFPIGTWEYGTYQMYYDAFYQLGLYLLTCAITMSSKLNGENILDYFQTLEQSYIILKYVHHAMNLEVVHVSQPSSIHKNVLLASTRLHSALEVLIKTNRNDLHLPPPRIDIPIFVNAFPVPEHNSSSSSPSSLSSSCSFLSSSIKNQTGKQDSLKRSIERERTIAKVQELLQAELLTIVDSFLQLYPKDKDFATFSAIRRRLKD